VSRNIFQESELQFFFDSGYWHWRRCVKRLQKSLSNQPKHFLKTTTGTRVPVFSENTREYETEPTIMAKLESEPKSTGAATLAEISTMTVRFFISKICCLDGSLA
jgi:hypothetical protein